MGVNDRQKFISSPDASRQIKFSHIFDMAKQSFAHSVPVYGDFLSESEQSDLIQKAHLLPCEYALFGGYEDADRKMIAFVPEYINCDYPLSVVSVTTPNLSRLTHRDFLGSVLGLGIKREKCGDIIISENSCSIILHSDIALFVRDNLLYVGREGVSTSITDLESLILAPKKEVEITGTVNSARLDSIIALFLKSGRNAATEYISQGRVFVDGICAMKNDMHLSGGEKISVRGKGKAVLKIGGQSKKGRIFITLNKYA